MNVRELPLRKAPTRVFPEALLRVRDVSAMVGLGKTEIYHRIKQGTFPRPVKLGAQLVAWRQSELLRWIAELPGRGAE